MIQTGTVVKSDSGRRLRVDGLIRSGGQGEAYWATEVNARQKGVLKVFHKRFANDSTVKRVRFLVDQDLCSACPALCAPIDILNGRGLVGHYTPLAEGLPLEDFLHNPNCTFLEQMQLAIALAHAIAVLHGRQIAHGDLHAENLIINHVGTVFQLHVIDLDNFTAPGLAVPPCAGHNLYMAPELRMAIAKGLPALPTIGTDRFSLGILMHEIILLRHPSAGADGHETDFEKAMCVGRWLQDPAAADRPTGDLGGYPAEVLNADLARLFRLAVDLDPAKRPASETWETELGKAFHSVYYCPSCSGPCVVDVSKITCPLCKTPFPHLTARIVADGRTLPLPNGTAIIGRAEVAGSMKVSARHATFRRVGPETWLESHGSNGTYRWDGSSWARLPDNRPLLVQSGDRLKLGDAEVLLE